MINKFKKYTIWTDDTSWTKTARESGLTYGVYNNEIKGCESREISGICTSRQEALDSAEKLNSQMSNPYEY
jgi:hypothetical protein